MSGLMLDFEEKELKRKKVLKEILTWCLCIGGVILLAFLIIHLVFEKTTMLDTSMEAALNKDDKIIINKSSYIFSSPKRFDVIVFKQSGKEHDYYGIKRVIGLPGEKIQIKKGIVYIDGKELEEKNIVDQMENAGLAEDEIELSDDEYFVLGDNRNNSEDSRYANVANIKDDIIIGKAWIKLKPFQIISKLNLIQKEEDNESLDTTVPDKN